MNFTEKDVPICKMLFNEATHEMGMLMYGERAKEIYKFVCTSHLYKDFFDYPIGDAFERILRTEPLASFFFDNGLFIFDSFSGGDITCLLIYSPICEKIWDSSQLENYLHRLTGFYIYRILTASPICEKIWDSDLLDPYFNKLDKTNLELLLAESPIADKIKASGKLNF